MSETQRHNRKTERERKREGQKEREREREREKEREKERERERKEKRERKRKRERERERKRELLNNNVVVINVIARQCQQLKSPFITLLGFGTGLRFSQAWQLFLTCIFYCNYTGIKI